MEILPAFFGSFLPVKTQPVMADCTIQKWITGRLSIDSVIKTKPPVIQNKPNYKRINIPFLLKYKSIGMCAESYVFIQVINAVDILCCEFKVEDTGITFYTILVN